jgi:hypothetical protein
MFDATAPITLKLPAPDAPDGQKRVTVRFPSDEEWTERQRARKIITKSFGRGMSKSDVPGHAEVDEAFVRRIKTAGPEVDCYEAISIVNALSQCDVTDVERDGTAYTVRMRVPGGDVSVGLRMPSAREIHAFRREYISSYDLPYGKSSTSVNLEAAARLFDALNVGEAVGYTGPVPIIHKEAALVAMIAEFESGLGVSDDNLF